MAGLLAVSYNPNMYQNQLSIRICICINAGFPPHAVGSERGPRLRRRIGSTARPCLFFVNTHAKEQLGWGKPLRLPANTAPDMSKWRVDRFLGLGRVPRQAPGATVLAASVTDASARAENSVPSWPSGTRGSSTMTLLRRFAGWRRVGTAKAARSVGNQNGFRHELSSHLVGARGRRRGLTGGCSDNQSGRPWS